MQQEITAQDLIAVAKSLRSDDGENAEYDRALVELVMYVTGGNGDNRDEYARLILS